MPAQLLPGWTVKFNPRALERKISSNVLIPLKRVFHSINGMTTKVGADHHDHRGESK